MEVKDETRDDSDGLLGENAKTSRGAAASDDATRPALENMVVVDAVVLLGGRLWMSDYTGLTRLTPRHDHVMVGGSGQKREDTHHSTFSPSALLTFPYQLSPSFIHRPRHRRLARYRIYVLLL